MDAQGIIAKRRDRIPESREELEFLARGAASGEIPDYQLAAWLMAAYLNPLAPEQTADLTRAMAGTGERLDLSGLPKPWLDKHSTGGVGDKTSIVLLPLLAACGLTVVKMSGRGLGITGGTVDKLESIPGFRMDLSPQEMKAQAARIGLAITGQSPNLAPADKALYALRDVTGTVGSIPLIVSSILSKKLAGGADTVVLDVKCGSGAFMPNLERARELARALADVGTRCGLRIRIAITDMDAPLGLAVGNALEVKEAFSTLGGASGRFAELCLELAGIALETCGVAPSREAGQERAGEALRSGAALAKARQWVEAQGGSATVFESDDWQTAPVVQTVVSDTSGWVQAIDARSVGEAAVGLGAGRRTKADAIDPRVGVLLRTEVGEYAESGQVLAEIHASEEARAAAAAASLAGAISISPEPTAQRPIVLEVI